MRLGETISSWSASLATQGVRLTLEQQALLYNQALSLLNRQRKGFVDRVVQSIEARGYSKNPLVEAGIVKEEDIPRLIEILTADLQRWVDFDARHEQQGREEWLRFSLEYYKREGGDAQNVGETPSLLRIYLDPPEDMAEFVKAFDFGFLAKLWQFRANDPLLESSQWGWCKTAREAFFQAAKEMAFLYDDWKQNRGPRPESLL